MPDIDWTVINVFDPDQPGTEFAYTVGAEPHVGAELHMWARPPEGDDPGDDWSWSHHDMAWVLNTTVIALSDGERHVGDIWHMTLDGGYTTVHFELRDGNSAPHGDTHRLRPGCPLIEIRWSLERQTGEPVNWAGDDIVAADTLAARLDNGTAARNTLWAPDVTSDTHTTMSDTPDLGPWTPIVNTWRTMLASGTSDEFWNAVLATLNDIEHIRHAAAAAAAASRAVGRRSEALQAAVVAGRDANQLATRYDSDDNDIVNALEQLCASWLTAAYTTAVVADIVDPDVVDHATGWLTAMADPVGATEPWWDLARQHRTDDTPNIDYWSGCVILAGRGRGAPLLIEHRWAKHLLDSGDHDDT